MLSKQPYMNIQKYQKHLAAIDGEKNILAEDVTCLTLVE